MKNTNNQFFKVIRIFLNLATIFFAIGLIWTVISFFSVDNQFAEFLTRKSPCSQLMTLSADNSMIVLNNPKLEECSYSNQIIVKFLKFARMTILVKLLFALFITIQLGLILKSFPFNVFKSNDNSQRIKFIALSILVFVILDFAIRFYPRAVIPEYLIYGSFGVNSLKSGFVSSLKGLNFSLLFVSGVTYLISLLFKRGNQLQQESDLTI